MRALILHCIRLVDCIPHCRASVNCKRKHNCKLWIWRLMFQHTCFYVAEFRVEGGAFFYSILVSFYSFAQSRSSQVLCRFFRSVAKMLQPAASTVPEPQMVDFELCHWLMPLHLTAVAICLRTVFNPFFWISYATPAVWKSVWKKIILLGNLNGDDDKWGKVRDERAIQHRFPLELNISYYDYS